jgi:arylsulfatase A-like enzyme
LRKNLARQCVQVDRPISGLLKDLKRRGLLDSTLVVWATEFGRTPNVEPRPDGEADPEECRGRDHHIYGFSAWMAGGGIKGGTVHGSTDELGFHAVEQRHYVTDIHATVLHLLGLDPRHLEIPGRKRLDVERGVPIREVLA